MSYEIKNSKIRCVLVVSRVVKVICDYSFIRINSEIAKCCNIYKLYGQG